MESEIQFVDIKVKTAYDKLLVSTTEENDLHEEISKALSAISTNAFAGIQIPKKQIPKDYMKKYRIRNLWKYNLSKGWRLLYSVESDGIKIISIILEWMNHKNYEKRMKYSKR